MKETFGQRFARLRKSKGYTQEQIADKVNISYQAVSKWEKDDAFPSVEFFPVLAALFGVSIDSLLGKEETASVDNNDERLVAFYEGYNDLDEADKDVLMATFDAFIKARKGDK